MPMINLKVPREDESLLIEQYSQPAFLPPLWRIIFQEAMRGHHIIFPRAIIDLMQNHDEFSRIAKIKNETLEEFCVQLFAAPDFTSIRTLIHCLPIEEQQQLFVIYVHMMRSIRDTHKQTSN